MAMKDLGTKVNEYYDHPTSVKEDKVRYPKIDLPLSVVKGLNLEVDDKVVVKLTGRICGLQDTEWTKCVTIEAQEGEVEAKEAETKKE